MPLNYKTRLQLLSHLLNPVLKAGELWLSGMPAAMEVYSFLVLFVTKLDVYFYIFLHMFRLFPLRFKCWNALFFPSCLSFLLFLVVPVITTSARSYIHILDCTQLWQGNLTALSDIFLRSKRKYICENNTLLSQWSRGWFLNSKVICLTNITSRILVQITMKRLITIMYCCSLGSYSRFLYILTIIGFLLLVRILESPAICFQIVRTDFHARYRVV